MQTSHPQANTPRRPRRSNWMTSMAHVPVGQLRWAMGLFLTGLGITLLLRALLPFALLLGMGAGSYWLWQQYQHHQQNRHRRETHLNAQFYDCLRHQQGRISVLDFALCTHLPGTAAQAYLNTQAQALGAYCERSLHGDLIYVFNWPALQNGTATHRALQAEAAWAYAEQAQINRRQAEKHHAAWVNAKQIRTLKKLAQWPSAPAGTTAVYKPAANATPAKAAATCDDGWREKQSPIVRGRAYSAPDRVTTIDVSAVNE